MSLLRKSAAYEEVVGAFWLLRLVSSSLSMFEIDQTNQQESLALYGFEGPLGLSINVVLLFRFSVVNGGHIANRC